MRRAEKGKGAGMGDLRRLAFSKPCSLVRPIPLLVEDVELHTPLWECGHDGRLSAEGHHHETIEMIIAQGLFIRCQDQRGRRKDNLSDSGRDFK